MTVADALAQALNTTGLAARFDAPDSVMIEMRGNHESVVVTKVKLNHLVDGRPTGMWHSTHVPGREAVHKGRWGVAPSILCTPKQRLTSL